MQEKNKRLKLEEENKVLSQKINEYRDARKLRINQAQMKSEVQASEDQIRIIRRELRNQENALSDLENEVFTEKRSEEINEQIIELEGKLLD